jgi:hypothetical protein
MMHAGYDNHRYRCNHDGDVHYTACKNEGMSTPFRLGGTDPGAGDVPLSEYPEWARDLLTGLYGADAVDAETRREERLSAQPRPAADVTASATCLELEAITHLARAIEGWFGRRRRSRHS